MDNFNKLVNQLSPEVRASIHTIIGGDFNLPNKDFETLTSSDEYVQLLLTLFDDRHFQSVVSTCGCCIKSSSRDRCLTGKEL